MYMCSSNLKFKGYVNHWSVIDVMGLPYIEEQTLNFCYTIIFYHDVVMMQHWYIVYVPW